MLACTKDDNSSLPNPNGDGGTKILMTADVAVYDANDNLIEGIDYKGISFFGEQASNEYVAQMWNNYIDALISTDYYDLDLEWSLNIVFSYGT